MLKNQYVLIRNLNAEPEFGHMNNVCPKTIGKDELLNLKTHSRNHTMCVCVSSIFCLLQSVSLLQLSLFDFSSSASLSWFHSIVICCCFCFIDPFICGEGWVNISHCFCIDLKWQICYNSLVSDEHIRTREAALKTDGGNRHEATSKTQDLP